MIVHIYYDKCTLIHLIIIVKRETIRSDISVAKIGGKSSSCSNKTKNERKHPVSSKIEDYCMEKSYIVYI